MGCLQPDLLAFFKRFVFGRPYRYLLGVRYRLLRSLPHGFGLGESGVDCGCEGVGLSHVCVWYVPHDQFERGLSGCCIWPSVMGILGEWEPSSPVSLCSVSEYSEVLFQPLVGPLGLSVRLWVVSGTDVLFDIQVFAQFPHRGGRLVMKSSAMHSKGCASGSVEIGN